MIHYITKALNKFKTNVSKQHITQYLLLQYFYYTTKYFDACFALVSDSDSDSGPREDMTDSDSSPAPYATTKEKYLNGLMKGPALSRRNVQIGYIRGRGRTAYAAKMFNPGDFVCEYGAVRRVKKSGEADKGEERNAKLGIGCYCLDAPYDGEMYTFDAAPKCNDPGR